jgi:hypothetical protein
VAEARLERIVHNEMVFRRANERLREDWRKLGMDELDEGLFLCECGDVECKQPLRVTLADYQAVRADPNAFVIAPGHEDARAETVVYDLVDENESFSVVRKHDVQGVERET